MALTDNLKAFWKLSDLTDEINDYTLTNNNTVTFSTGKIGNAAYFNNASSQFLSIPNANLGALNPNGTAYSFSLWFYLSSSIVESLGLLGTGSNSNNGFLLYLTEDVGTPYINFFNAGFSFVKLTTIQSWHNIIVSVSNSGVINYCYNGDYIAGNTTVSPVAGLADFTIGNVFNSFFMNGRIDGVGFWSRVLSQEEMLELWNNGEGLELTSESPQDISTNITRFPTNGLNTRRLVSRSFNVY